jgi:hypothetical protein
MSDYSILWQVAESLKKFLSTKMAEVDANIGSQIIKIGPPKNTEQDKGVYIWIYRVNPNGDLRNCEGPKKPKPLPLDLHALITPYYSSSETELKVLGAIMQILHTWPFIYGSQNPDPALQEDYEIRCTQEALTLEELSQVWNSLSQPFHLSAAYLVSYVTLDSLKPASDPTPVKSTSLHSGQILHVLPQELTGGA